MNGVPTRGIDDFFKLMKDYRQYALNFKMTELPKKIPKKTNDESIVMIYGQAGTGKSSLKLLLEGKDIFNPTLVSS